jgi:predicted RNA methylase
MRGTTEATEVLDLGSDLALRYRYFTRGSLGHPAKLHLGLLAWLIERYTAPGDTIADPMAGIGSTAYAALLQRNVILREIESRWLELAHENAAQIIREAGMFAGIINVGQADAREPWGFEADHVIFSPPYACETKRDPSARARMLLSRLERLGAQRLHYGDRWRLLAERGDHQAGAAGLFNFAYGSHPAQLGHLRGVRYWSEMEQVYARARAALRPGGKMILVIKDHIRDGQRIRVADETAQRCEALGFCLTARHARRVWPLSLWQRRRKEQGKPIVEDEDILVFTTGERR